MRFRETTKEPTSSLFRVTATMASDTSETNVGSSWTPEEETQLLNELATTASIDDIAASHKRTSGAIRARQNFIGRRMVVNEGIPIEEAALRVRQPVSSIEQSIATSQKSLANAQDRRNCSAKKDESILSVMMEVRDLLKQMLANQRTIMRSM
jgi:hypothetical protein